LLPAGRNSNPHKRNYCLFNGNAGRALALTLIVLHSEEGVMKLCIATIVLLTASVGIAAAQTSVPGTIETPSAPPLTTPSSQIQLTPAQKTAILDAVKQDGKKVAAGAEFIASIGAPVPPQLELYILPDSALATVPAAKSVKYTTVQNQIVLVDPTTMRVVEIIPQ
jgi:hypothetical protein